MELPNTHAHTYRDTRTHAHTKTKKKMGKKKDVTTNSKPQSLTLVRIKDYTLSVPNKTTTLLIKAIFIHADTQLNVDRTMGQKQSSKVP